MVKYGRKVGYLPSAIDRWVESRARVCKSTSNLPQIRGPERSNDETQRNRRAGGLTRAGETPRTLAPRRAASAL